MSIMTKSLCNDINIVLGGLGFSIWNKNISFKASVGFWDDWVNVVPLSGKKLRWVWEIILYYSYIESEVTPYTNNFYLCEINHWTDHKLLL